MRSAYRYAVLAGDAPDPTAGPDPWVGLPDYPFNDGINDGTTRILWIRAWDNPLIVSLSHDGVNFGDDIEIDDGDPPVPYYFAAQRARIRNETAGNVSKYQIIGFW